MATFNSNETAGKIITCKAAVAWGPNKPLVIEQVRVEPPQAKEVRLKILYTSICHTDLSFLEGKHDVEYSFPRIFGHEAVGVVESVGDDVHDLKEGDFAIPIFNGECGACEYCLRPDTNLCKDFRASPHWRVMGCDGRCRFSTMDGEPIFHFLNTSTFVEYTVISAACVVKLSADSAIKKMSLLSCGFTTGAGAAWNVADVQAGSSVAIFGLGAVGLATAEGARVRGVKKIIGVDINPGKFKIAESMGVTAFVDPNDVAIPVHERIREMTGGGVDYSFECTGSTAVIREAFLSTHDGWGKTVLVGIFTAAEMLPLHPMELFDGRTITGTCFGGFKGKSQLPELAKKCSDGEVNLDGFITHELPFDHINEAFRLLSDGEALRCLLHF